MKRAARVISVFLIFGGLLGLLGTYFLAAHAVRNHQEPQIISTILSALLFAWCILSGIELWREKPRGLRFAKILFALQIPVFTVARFTYEFSTLFSLRLMIGNTSRTIGANIGSSGNIHLSPQSSGFLAGINLVAVIAFCGLYAISQFNKMRPAFSVALNRSY